MTGILWTTIALLFIAWLLGFAINVGWWINILLVLAIIGFIVQLVTTAAQRTPGY